MTVKKILEVDIQDESYQRFVSKFKEFEAAFKAMPAEWRALAKGIRGAEGEVERYSRATKDAARATKAAEEAGAGMAKAWSSFGTGMRGGASIFESILGSARGITSEFAKWGGLFAAGSALGAGGALFGLSNLAGSTFDARRRALGYGTNIGGLRSFETNFDRFGNPDSVLGGTSDALHDITQRWRLGAAGLRGNEINENDTAATAANLILRAQQVAKASAPDTLNNTMDMFGFTGLGISHEMALRLRNMTTEEARQQAKSFAANRASMDIRDAQAKAWTDFSTQLTRAGKQIDATFVDKLTPLVGPLGKLSEGVVQTTDTFMNAPKISGWINDAAKGLNALADTVGTPSFQKNVTTFADNVDKLAEAALAWKALSGVGSFMGGAAGAAVGSGIAAGGIGAWWSGLAKGALRWGGPIGAFIAGMWPSSTATSEQERQAMQGGPGTSNGISPQQDTWADMLHRWTTSWRAGTFSQDEDRFHLPRGLLGTVERQESGGRDVTSAAGAQGYFQFMPDTARLYGVDPHDEKSSAFGAAYYLSDLRKQFASQVAPGDDLKAALAAYNWGPQNVQDDLRKYGAAWQEHLPGETQRYLSAILTELKNLQNQRTDPQIKVQNQAGANVTISGRQLGAAW